MRLLSRKIYRAFPELDDYDDERCQRFIDAAVSLNARTAVRSAAIGVTFVVLCVAAVIVVSKIDFWVYRPNNIYIHTSAQRVLSWLVLGGPVLAIPPLGAFVVRDVLLRLRVREVIRAGGSCSGCSYSLIGIPLKDDNTVVCPECGLACDVDPSLRELVDPQAGVAVFTVDPE